MKNRIRWQCHSCVFRFHRKSTCCYGCWVLWLSSMLYLLFSGIVMSTAATATLANRSAARGVHVFCCQRTLVSSVLHASPSIKCDMVLD